MNGIAGKAGEGRQKIGGTFFGAIADDFTGATDLAGRTQPEAPEWNRFGYGNNSIQTITLQVGATQPA